MTHCSPAVLVGLDVELPADPGIANDAQPPRVGCNHLVCGSCGADVRHVDSRTITSHYPPAHAELDAIYNSDDPASSPHFDAAPVDQKSRAYFCRCSWAAVNLGGTKSLGSIDAPWECGGHAPRVVEAQDIRVAEAQKQADVLAQTAPPVATPGAKIRIVYASRVNPELSTTSELRDALLASYPDASFFQAPVVDTGVLARR